MKDGNDPLTHPPGPSLAASLAMALIFDQTPQPQVHPMDELPLRPVLSLSSTENVRDVGRVVRTGSTRGGYW